MMRLNSFLCLKLDTVGRLVAWFGMITYGILMFCSILLLLKPLMMPCGDIENHSGIVGSIFPKDVTSYASNGCNALKILALWACLWIFIVFVGLFYMHLALYQGINKRRSSQIVPMIISKASDVFVNLLFFVFCDSIKSYFYVAFLNVVSIYILLVLVSIRVKIKEEKVEAVKFRMIPA